jgi:ABC-type nitrate/sulfonate/bicarbonate transport system ATPase subunit
VLRIIEILKIFGLDLYNPNLPSAFSSGLQSREALTQQVATAAFARLHPKFKRVKGI